MLPEHITPGLEWCETCAQGFLLGGKGSQERQVVPSLPDQGAQILPGATLALLSTTAQQVHH